MGEIKLNIKSCNKLLTNKQKIKVTDGDCLSEKCLTGGYLLNAGKGRRNKRCQEFMNKEHIGLQSD